MDVKFWKDKSRKQVNPDVFSSAAESLAEEIAKDRKGKRIISSLQKIGSFFGHFEMLWKL